MWGSHRGCSATGERKDNDGKDKDFLFSNKEVHVVAETEKLAHRLQ